MSDADEKGASGSTKIVGSSTVGAETSYISAQTYGTQVGLDIGVNALPEYINANFGQMFHVGIGLTALTGTTEVPLILFKNPNASGKTARIYRISIQPTLGNNYVTYSFYIDPTVTANGTALTPVGNRQTSQNASIINAFKTPTVTSNGSLIKSETMSGLTGNGRDIFYNFSLYVEANHSLLITRDLSANATIGGFNIEWMEQ